MIGQSALATIARQRPNPRLISVAIKDSHRDAPASWPSAEELMTGGDRVVIFPDRLEKMNGELTAAFRPDAQAIRVDAAAAGVEVELWAPAGARRAVYEEHAAVWVLPLLLGIPASVVAGLLTNLIQERIDAWRARGAPAPAPEVRCGLVEIEQGKLRVRDLEGSAEEVRDILLGLAEETTASADPEDGNDGDAGET